MRMPGLDPMSKNEIKEKGEEDYNSQKLSDIEMLILKPHRQNISITDLTEEEIKKYLEIDIEMLEKENKEGAEKIGTSEKLIRICAQTQKYIKENLEDILTVIRQKNAEKTEKEDKENGQER